MKNKLRGLMHYGLFIKMVLIVVFSVTCVAAFTLGISIRASEDAYVSSFSTSSAQIITQIRENMLQYHDEVSGIFSVLKSSWAFRSYLTGMDRTTVTASYTVYSMNKQLESALPPNYYDKLGLVVVGVDGTAYVGGDASLTVPVEELLAMDITRKTREQPNRILYQFVPRGFTTLTKTSSAVVITTALCYAGSSQTPYGYAYIIVNQNVLSGFYEALSNTSSNLLLLSEDGIVLSSTNDGIIGTPAPVLLGAAKKAELGDSYENMKLDARQVTVVAREIGQWNCHLVSVIDRESVLDEVENQKLLIGMTLCVTIAVLCVMFFILRKTTKPLHALVGRMHRVTDGDFGGHIPVQGSYEVRELSTAFNHMLDGLNSYVEKLMTVENEKRQAELHALQMQINPHFVYNTLTSLKWMIWQGDSERSVRAIDAFSMLLRNTIGNREEMVTAGEEAENLKNYVFLQHIRFGSQIQADISLEEGCRACLMPKLLLQPFLENAFFHAFQEVQNGYIHVFIGRRGANLVSEIIDNGTGMSAEQAARLLSTEGKKDAHFTGIGISNVNDRIKLLFGGAYGVSISSEPNNGTTVTVTIPAREKPANEKTDLKITSKSEKNTSI